MEENFLEKLRSADEGTKRRWVFATSVILMVVVVYVWLAYFNSLVGSVATADPSNNQSGGFTFFETVRNGIASVYNFFTGWVGSFSKILETPRDYIVNPPR